LSSAVAKPAKCPWGDGTPEAVPDVWATWVTSKREIPPPKYSTLTGSVHTTVNALREAFAIQKVLELDARGGTRYFEILKAHFGVVISKVSTNNHIAMNVTMLNEGFLETMVM
jgi:hypothetical protein